MASRSDHQSPRSLFQILDGSLRHYRSEFVRLLLPFVPMAIIDVISTLLNAAMQAVSFQAGVESATPPPAVMFLMVLVFATALARWVVYLIGYGASVIVAASDLQDEPRSPREAWDLSRGRFWMLFGLTVIVGFLVTVGLFFLVIPGIYLAVRLLVSPQTVLLENQNAGDAIGRSNELVQGHFWRGFVTMVFPLILVTALTLPMTVVGVGSVFFIDENGEITPGFYAAMALTGLFSVIVNLLLSPLASVVFTHFYWDLRLRKEGLDLVTKLRELESSK